MTHRGMQKRKSRQFPALATMGTQAQHLNPLPGKSRGNTKGGWRVLSLRVQLKRSLVAAQRH